MIVDKRYLEAAEKLGWRIEENYAGNALGFAKPAPSTEVYKFWILTENFPEGIINHAIRFSPDSYAIERINLTDYFGGLYALMQDGEAVRGMIYELAGEMMKVWNEIRGECD